MALAPAVDTHLPDRLAGFEEADPMRPEIVPRPITMGRTDTSLTVAEPLGMLEAGWKKTRYFWLS